MAKGAATAPTFTMPGGTIKNSNTSDTGFPKVQPNGSATVSGGEIYHNIASKGNGGGIYVHSTDNDVEVKILGGTVQYNAADGRDPNTGKSAIMNITSDVSLYAQWEKN